MEVIIIRLGNVSYDGSTAKDGTNRFQIVTINVCRTDIELIDQLTEIGRFASRCEAIRFCLTTCLPELIKTEEEKEEFVKQIELEGNMIKIDGKEHNILRRLE